MTERALDPLALLAGRHSVADLMVPWRAAWPPPGPAAWPAEAAVPPDMPLPQAAARLLQHGLARLVVVDAAGQPLGWLGARRLRRLLQAGTEAAPALAHPLTDPPGGGGDIRALRRTEQEFRQLFAANPAPMLIYARQSLALVAVNEAFERLYGHSAEQARTLRLTDLYPSADQAPLHALVQQLHGLANVGEWRHLRRDGSLLPVVVQSHDIGYDGQDCRVAVITDLSPMKRAEAALAAERDRLRITQYALDRAADIVIWFHRDGRLHYVNDAACVFLGGPREALLALPAGALCDDWSAEALAAAWPRWQQLAGGHAGARAEEGERWLRTLDGRRQPVALRTTLVDADGEQTAFVLATGIAQRLRAAQREQARLALLESLARGASLPTLLARLARDHEALFPGSRCAVMLADADQRSLRVGAAPSLPAGFAQALQGLAIGAGQPCGGAALYQRQRVVVECIADHPDWHALAPLALAAGLQACWSQPIIGAGGRLLGSVDVYQPQPGAPADESLAEAAVAAQLAATAIASAQTAADLRDSERRLSDILRAMPDLVWMTDAQGLLRAVNPALERLLGRPTGALIGLPPQAVADADTAEAMSDGTAQVLASGLPRTQEAWFAAPSGERRWFETIRTPLFDDAGRASGVLCVARDITQARQSAQANAEQARLIDTMFSQTTDAIALIDPDSGNFLFFNDAACAGLGYSREAFGRLGPVDIQDALNPAQVRAIAARVLSGEQVALQTRHRRADGVPQLVDLTLRQLTYDGRLLVAAVWRDITEAVNDARRIHRLNRAYAVLSDVSEAMVRVRDPQQLYAEVCRIGVDVGGLRLLWVGRASADGLTVRPVAHAGHAAGFFDSLPLQLRPPRGPAALALTSGEPCIVDDIAHDPRTAHLREASLSRGYRAVAAFPVRVNGVVRDCLCVCADSVGHFDAEQVALLSRLAQGLGHGLALIEAQAAQRREQQFRAELIDSVAGLLYVLDGRGRLVLWNRQFEALTGLAREQLAQRPATAFFAEEERAEIRANLDTVLAQGQAQVEATLLSVDGQRRRYLFVSRRIGSDDGDEPGQARIVGTGIDITDRARADAELGRYRERLEAQVAQRTAELEALNAQLHREDQRLRTMLSLSQQASSLTEAQLVQGGVEAVLQLTGSALGAVFSASALPAAAPGQLQMEAWSGDAGARPAWPDAPGGDAPAPWQQARDSDEPVHASAGQCAALGLHRLLCVPVSEDGRVRLVLCAADKPTAFDADDARALWLIGTDLWRIVRRRRVEIALQRAKLAADAANQAKSTFLANMSHEIRTPMNAIVGFAHLLKRDPLTTRQRDNLGKINDASQHLLQVINDVLDFSKIEAHKIELEATDFALRDSLERVMAMVAERSHGKPVVLSMDTAGCPQRLRGDRLRLEQILLNLLGNAVKFTDRGRVQVRVRALPLPDWPASAGSRLRFEVEDTGIGVRESQLPHLFEAFEQADVSTTRRFGGTGLGLAISKRLAELMGGAIGVTSRLGLGSTFWFELPFQPPQALPAVPLPAPARPAWAAARPLQGARVLLAEDNAINQEVATALLQAMGIQVDVAEDGEAAVQQVTKQRYDLVLMDVQMPVMDGLLATRQIRAQPGMGGLPIVAMTANAFDDDRQRCLAAGMDDYLAKPVEPAALLACLQRWLGGQPAAAGPAATAEPAPLLDQLHTLAGVDLAPALARMRGSRPLYLRTLRLFQQHHADDVALLGAPATGAAERWAQVAHSVAGAAATLGAQAVAREAQALQALLGPGTAEPSAAACQQAQALAAALAGFLGAIDQLLAAPDTPPDGPPAPVPWPDVARSLHELAPLLRHHDTSAADRLEAALPLLTPALGTLAARLSQQVQAFSFEDAQHTLAQALAQLPPG